MERRKGGGGENIPGEEKGIEGEWEEGRTAQAGTDGVEIEVGQ